MPLGLWNGGNRSGRKIGREPLLKTLVYHDRDLGLSREREAIMQAIKQGLVMVWDLHFWKIPLVSTWKICHKRGSTTIKKYCICTQMKWYCKCQSSGYLPWERNFLCRRKSYRQRSLRTGMMGKRIDWLMILFITQHLPHVLDPETVVWVLQIHGRVFGGRWWRLKGKNHYNRIWMWFWTMHRSHVSRREKHILSYPLGLKVFWTNSCWVIVEKLWTQDWLHGMVSVEQILAKPQMWPFQWELTWLPGPHKAQSFQNWGSNAL